MAWLAVDKDGRESIFRGSPYRHLSRWLPVVATNGIFLPKGSVEKLIGRELTWDDEPVEIKDA